MTICEQLMTVEEFEAFLALPENRDRNFELIDGEIVEKLPSQVHGRLVASVIGEVGIWLKRFPIGYVETEVRYRVPSDGHNSRQPDISVVLDVETPPVNKGAVLRMPDIAIEVKSPDDSYKGMRERAAYYIANGSKMVWLIFPEKRLIDVYHPNADIDVLDVSDTLTGYGLLPEFSLPVSNIFKIVE